MKVLTLVKLTWFKQSQLLTERLPIGYMSLSQQSSAPLPQMKGCIVVWLGLDKTETKKCIHLHNNVYSKIWGEAIHFFSFCDFHPLGGLGRRPPES